MTNLERASRASNWWSLQRKSAGRREETHTAKSWSENSTASGLNMKMDLWRECFHCSRLRIKMHRWARTTSVAKHPASISPNQSSQTVGSSEQQLLSEAAFLQAELRTTKDSDYRHAGKTSSTAPNQHIQRWSRIHTSQRRACDSVLSRLPWKPGRAAVAGAPGGGPGVHISVNPAQIKLHFSPKQLRTESDSPCWECRLSRERSPLSC